MSGDVTFDEKQFSVAQSFGIDTDDPSTYASLDLLVEDITQRTEQNGVEVQEATVNAVLTDKLFNNRI